MFGNSSFNGMNIVFLHLYLLWWLGQLAPFGEEKSRAFSESLFHVLQFPAKGCNAKKATAPGGSFSHFVADIKS
ncbi:hypothetical protein [Paenibacillus rigui]|uniref:Uncharacterized protein n=1 Tax=Paenibacillus rigui TaxID=554312 RepID=A0A229UW73_9BACL|nr:hypothetical protein [Paenibacillus rigui]OXM87149.1 hypothetical protein CF651_05710 [Paenibacillus rigui]